MKFGFRVPSLKKRLSARLSAKRYIRHNLVTRPHSSLKDKTPAAFEKLNPNPYL
jgi:hypothetical protein